MKVVAPVESHDDHFFWAGAKEGRLLIQRCSSCGTLRHPPAPMCGACLSTDWDAQEASGRGTVYSWILSKHPTREDAEPRVVALIELEEGTRLVSNLVDIEPAAIENDMAVEVCFVEANDGQVVLPQFRPAGAAGGGATR